MKMAILYHSETGNTKKMAEVIVSAMNSVKGAEARAFSIDDIDADWVKESRCVIVGTPIYMAGISGKMKMWLEKEAGKLDLAGHIGGAFATAIYVHGGGELGIREILDHMMVFSMLAYSGGGMLGKPVIHLGPVAIDGHLDEYMDTFSIYGKRMAEKTLEIFK